MRTPPRIGLTGTRTFRVGPEHAIIFADDRMPPVLSTPNLIQELERTAREAVQHLLEADERTVGVEVDLRHLAPSVPGFDVTCTARVIGCDGEEITFSLEARDREDLLARGMHRRRVVNTSRLRRRIERKEAARDRSPGGG
jgi:predicted thioesterase